MATLVVADFSDAAWAVWWPLLRAAMPAETLLRPGAGTAPEAVDVALVANPPPGSLAGLPRLRLIQSLWAGVDRLLDDASVPRDVPLARMVDPGMNEAMAQTVLWAVLGAHRGFLDAIAAQRRQEWLEGPVRRADEVCVGVLGLGQMGRAAARRLREAGYRVLGWRRGGADAPDPQPFDPQAGVDAASVHRGRAGLLALCGRADVVVNLLPLTPATRGLFDAEVFAAMRRGALFVNLGRGAHVVPDALRDALARGAPGRAVLDVFATEPLPRGDPLWSHPSVTVLPHLGAPTDPRSACAVAARNIAALRAGGPLQHLVERVRGY